MKQIVVMAEAGDPHLKELNGSKTGRALPSATRRDSNKDIAKQNPSPLGTQTVQIAPVSFLQDDIA
jgi:hypothetical protein